MNTKMAIMGGVIALAAFLYLTRKYIRRSLCMDPFLDILLIYFTTALTAIKFGKNLLEENNIDSMK